MRSATSKECMDLSSNEVTVSITIRPVGEVRSELKKASMGLEKGLLTVRCEEGAHGVSGDLVSELLVYEQFSDCLEGIEEFSHILVLYWSHRVPEEDRKVTRVHPGGQEDMPLVGVFSTRSPVRPNPVCATTVRLLARRGNVLEVKGLDAIDGSPVIDIKPHHPHFDAPGEVRLAGWMEVLMKRMAVARGE